MLLAVCMENVKTSIIAFLIVLALSAIFSTVGNTYEFSGTGPFVGDTPGESGVVIPGGGEDPVEVMTPNIDCDVNEGEFEKKADVAEGETNLPNDTIQTTQFNKYIAKEKKTVSKELIAYWHGVGTVLIGEVAAIVISFLWIKFLPKIKSAFGVT